ncbi:MAG: hypothetical protein IPN94_20065 [Sphingobacteriales bacterium]|nr:hypothetical protein [Sphingobacteriales bacterium]
MVDNEGLENIEVLKLKVNGEINVTKSTFVGKTKIARNDDLAKVLI